MTHDGATLLLGHSSNLRWGRYYYSEQFHAGFIYCCLDPINAMFLYVGIFQITNWICFSIGSFFSIFCLLINAVVKSDVNDSQYCNNSPIILHGLHGSYVTQLSASYDHYS